MHIDDNIRAGMSPQEAKRVAVMKLGGIDLTYCLFSTGFNPRDMRRL